MKGRRIANSEVKENRSCLLCLSAFIIQLVIHGWECFPCKEEVNRAHMLCPAFEARVFRVPFQKKKKDILSKTNMETFYMSFSHSF